MPKEIIIATQLPEDGYSADHPYQETAFPIDPDFRPSGDIAITEFEITDPSEMPEVEYRNLELRGAIAPHITRHNSL